MVCLKASKNVFTRVQTCGYDGCYTMTPNYSNNNNFNYVDSTVDVST